MAHRFSWPDVTPLSWLSHKMVNVLQSALLLLGMALLLVCLGWLIAGSSGVIFAGIGMGLLSFLWVMASPTSSAA